MYKTLVRHQTNCETERCKRLVCAIISMTIFDYVNGRKRYKKEKEPESVFSGKYKKTYKKKAYLMYKEAEHFLFSGELDYLIDRFQLNVCASQIRKRAESLKKVEMINIFEE